MMEMIASNKKWYKTLKDHSIVFIFVLLVVFSILSNNRSILDVSGEYGYLSDHEIIDEKDKISDEHPL
jgi:hypothetical protein